MGSLFPCLPDGIGWECLLRVKLNYHHNLRCVCKSWNAALKSPHFYQERKRLKISEQRICLLDADSRVAVYDLAENSCKSLPPIPVEIYRVDHCHFTKQKLVLITDDDDGTNSCVWLFDFACSKWRQGATLLTWLDDFASAADEDGGLIYVGGGFDGSLNPVCSASVYNVEEDNWDFLPDMNTLKAHGWDCFRGAFADGKFYVYVFGEPFESNFEVFDSYTRSWKTTDNRFNCKRLVSAFGRLYFSSPRGFIEYDCRQDKFNVVEPQPMEWELGLGTEVGHNIFMKGRKRSEGTTFCMLAPPSETGGAFKWIDIERPSGFHGVAYRVATLDL